MNLRLWPACFGRHGPPLCLLVIKDECTDSSGPTIRACQSVWSDIEHDRLEACNNCLILVLPISSPPLLPPPLPPCLSPSHGWPHRLCECESYSISISLCTLIDPHSRVCCIMCVCQHRVCCIMCVCQHRVLYIMCVSA